MNYNQTTQPFEIVIHIYNLSLLVNTVKEEKREANTREAKEMQERLETVEQTASSSSRELQQSAIGREWRRPATPKRSTKVSCNWKQKKKKNFCFRKRNMNPRHSRKREEVTYHLELESVYSNIVVARRTAKAEKEMVFDVRTFFWWWWWWWVAFEKKRWRENAWNDGKKREMLKGIPWNRWGCFSWILVVWFKWGGERGKREENGGRYQDAAPNS